MFAVGLAAMKLGLGGRVRPHWPGLPVAAVILSQGIRFVRPLYGRMGRVLPDASVTPSQGTKPKRL